MMPENIRFMEVKKWPDRGENLIRCALEISQIMEMHDLTWDEVIKIASAMLESAEMMKSLETTVEAEE